MEKLNLPNDCFVSLMGKYTPDVTRIFNYLNGQINKINRCILTISYFSSQNYAQFQYPNLITVFLGSIINNFYDRYDDERYTPDDFVLSVAALSIAHELFHADQDVDSKKYKNDGDYANNIENAAEYNAEKFCIEHMTEFKVLFGFNYVFPKKIVSPMGVYELCDPKHFYPHMLLGLFRNIKIYDDLMSLINSKTRNNVFVEIRYSDKLYVGRFPIKVGGEIPMDSSSISNVVSILNQFRYGSSTMMFEMGVYTDEYVVDDIDVSVYVIDIVNITYNPFVF